MKLPIQVQGIIVAAAMLLTFSNSPAHAEKLSFLICQPGGPDLKEQEQAIIRDFYHYIGKKLGLKEDSIDGEYLTKRKKCISALSRSPSILMLSLDMFLTAKKNKNLEAIAQIKIKGKTNSQFYLMSNVEGASTVEALRGKLISGTTVHDPEFVGRIIMKDKLGPPSELVLKAKKMGLRAVRAVIRGKSSAVLLDEPQYLALKDTPFEKKLKLVYTSDALPNPPIAIDKKQVSAALRAKIKKIMLTMTSDKAGQKLLKTFGIDDFVEPQADTWKKLEAIIVK